MNISENQEDSIDKAFRPKSFEDFLGQEATIDNLRVYVASAKLRREPLDHILLACAPGTGKTTLANILANEMGSRLHTVNAPSIKAKGEVIGLLASLERNDILFLDEIHGLNPKIAELLYPALEDGKLEVVTGQGALSSAVSLALNPFTLIGATTREGKLERPLRDRFGYVVHLQPYSVEELSTIIVQNAEKLDLWTTRAGALELARRSCGTPRIANRILRRIRDFAQVRGEDTITESLVAEICDRLEIDSLGLDKTSQKYLKILTDKGSPVSFNHLASLLSESRDTIEEVVEPHLLRLGFIEITPKGRVATRAGFRHLHQEQ